VETSVAVRTRLRRRACLAAVVSLSATAVARAALATVLGPEAATRWSVVAGAAVCVKLAFLAVNLDRNRPAGAAALRPRLGSANIVTLARGTLLAWLTGFAVVGWRSGPLAVAPVALYAGNVALDGVDGVLARRVGHVSALGARLDAEFDGLGVFVGVGVAVAADLLPTVLLLVGLVKYIYLVAAWLARRHGRPLGTLPPRASRRPLAALQMLAVTAVLSALLVPAAATLVVIAAGLAYGAGFARDWRLRHRRANERVDLVG
jgi:CDP-diacylglycerol--glycerol-3-phosphate 3-phosphatidyltransferase